MIDFSFFLICQEYEAIYLARLTIKMMSPVQLGRPFSIQAGMPGEALVQTRHTSFLYRDPAIMYLRPLIRTPLLVKPRWHNASVFF